MGDAAACFLGVERSLTGRAWRERPSCGRTALALCQRLGVPEILGRILAARGVKVEESDGVLDPKLRALMPDPSILLDMDAGADRLAAAIVSGERIGIICDYDVDGVSSAALLLRFLEAAGQTPLVHVPDRMTEGYGPSRKGVELLARDGATLLVTLDCGINATDPLTHASELGLDTIVVDHHLQGASLPPARALINPNRHDDVSGLGHLCAAGVTLMLLAGANRALRKRGFWNGKTEPDLLAGLDLVALATICDVVPLSGLNRAFVQQGLKVMSRRHNPGIAALADIARLKRLPDTHALGFLLGPRINAAGRVGHARAALKLLTTADRGEAARMARELEDLNRNRQQIELRVLETATAEAERLLDREGVNGLVMVAGENWHPGVLGLVASRLVERHRLPSFALGFATGASHAAGSGRSVPGVDLGQAVRAAAEEGLLVKGGGHPMAAGVTVDRARIGDLKAFLSERLKPVVAERASVEALDIDGAMTAAGATVPLIEMIERAGPYGAGNPAPVFAFPAHRVVYADLAGSDHVRVTLENDAGQRIKAIAFRALNTELGERLLAERGRPVHVAGRLALDTWTGAKATQVIVDDVAAVAV
ncbi:MAG: single-stranded-DNA-specific exonuclease RecJ [Hyphomicrobiales bacterium]